MIKDSKMNEKRLGHEVLNLWTNEEHKYKIPFRWVSKGKHPGCPRERRPSLRSQAVPTPSVRYMNGVSIL